MHRLIYTFILHIIIQSNLVSQIYIYGGNNSEASMSMIPANDDGFILTGFSESADLDFNGQNKGEEDIFILKINYDGKPQWLKSFGGSDEEISTKIIPIEDGYILIGITKSNNFDFYGLNKGNEDVVIIKINNKGEKKWIRTFGGSKNDVAFSIVKANDNGFIITGTTESIDYDFEGLNNGETDIFVLKINEAGEKQWVKKFGTYGKDVAYTIISDKNNGYILAGSYNHNSGDLSGQFKGNFDVPIIKISNNGEFEWFKSLGGSEKEICYSIIIDNDGNYLLTGESQSNDGDFSNQNKGRDDIFVIKLNKFFDKIWVKTYGGSESETGISIIVNSKGHYLVSGVSRSNDQDLIGMNRGREDAYILEIDKDGNKVWLRTFGGDGNDCCNSIIYTSTNEYLISGISSSNFNNFETIKRNSSNIYFQKIKLK